MLQFHEILIFEFSRLLIIESLDNNSWNGTGEKIRIQKIFDFYVLYETTKNFKVKLG